MEGREQLRKIAVTRQVVLSTLLELLADTSQGPNGHHAGVLREVVNEIVDALVLIFQNSLDSWECLIRLKKNKCNYYSRRERGRK